MHSKETEEEFPDIVAKLRQKRAPLPVVQIEDRLTPLPFASYYTIVDLVESALREREG